MAGLCGLKTSLTGIQGANHLESFKKDFYYIGNTKYIILVFLIILVFSGIHGILGIFLNVLQFWDFFSYIFKFIGTVTFFVRVRVQII